MSDLKVLFIGKEDHAPSEKAADFIRSHFKDPLIVFSKRTEPFPAYLNGWQGDLLISFLAQWIIPAAVLQNAKWAAINFHPGPPEYPGIGCTNFAVYNKEKEFGITCHHMLARVDSGAIIAVRRFPVHGNDTVYSITQRCYAEILELFFELMGMVLSHKNLPQTKETWKRKPYTRKQLNQLCELTPGMSQEEIDLRVKATTYGDKVWAFMKTGENITSYSSYKE
jgi:methionyl-tRNA formyltransferase